MKNIENLKDIGFYTLSDDRAKNISLTSQMKRGEIILLEACNFNCPYCRGLKDEIYGDRKDKKLSLEEVKNIIDIWCDPLPIENIRFSGGEPTLHPDIIEIVTYAKLKGVKRIAISTNGSNDFNLYQKLIECGVNDCSISLDACCAEVGDKMSGGIKNSWDKVVDNIKNISKICYVTVGIVLTKDNIDTINDIIVFADSLGVADIRIISSAQENFLVAGLEKIPIDILEKHPILKYRVIQFIKGENVRGISEKDCHKCHLVHDDSAIAGKYAYPCIIWLREGGDPICEVGPDMRQKRHEWFLKHNSYDNLICRKNCIDACVELNNKIENYKNKI